MFCEACLALDGLAAQQAIQTALQTTLSYLSDAFDKSAGSRADSGGPNARLTEPRRRTRTATTRRPR